MTGYGIAVTELQSKKITAEIKSLNSKSLNLYIKYPDIYREKENDLRNMISSILERGKIELFINIEFDASKKKALLNKNLIFEYYDILEEIATEKKHNLKEEQIFQAILRLPDVLKTQDDVFNIEDWDSLILTVNQAINQLEQFRIQEGAALQKDITLRNEKILELLTQIEPYENERVEKIKEKLTKRLDEVFEKSSQDKNRFEQEIIFYLEKIDITEEKVRLKNHCKFLNETFSDNDAPGRKLGFICQEMGREINTLGSKANHTEIQKIVILMKDELEKIKEQILNIL